MAFNFLSRNNTTQQPTANTDIKSPDFLGHRPNKDVIRIGRKPIFFTGFILVAAAGVMIYTFAIKSMGFAQTTDGTKIDPLASEIPILDKKPSAGVISADTGNNQPKIAVSDTKNPVLVPPPDPTASLPEQDNQFQMLQQLEQEKRQLEQAKRATLQNALSAEPTVFTDNQKTENHKSVLAGLVKQDDYSQPQPSNVNIPTEPPDTANYLLHTRVHPVSPYELKAGSVIPAVMLGGINSDLPGQIIAQVSQGVYDTATGQYLLIPQGAKLVGNYDHQIVSGQSRVLVVWHRLIYPDASSVNLGSMDGADQSGYAGFKEKTNTHFFPTFRNAIMLSLITAGVQMSQPQAKTGSTYSGQQMIAGSMGMQMNNLGTLTLGRNLNQPPTIQISPGYVFNVMINKDMILPPWNGSSVAYGRID